MICECEQELAQPELESVTQHPVLTLPVSEIARSFAHCCALCGNGGQCSANLEL
jgi:hypothetical protein